MVNQIRESNLPNPGLAEKIRMQPFCLPRNAAIIESASIDLSERMSSLVDFDNSLAVQIFVCVPTLFVRLRVAEDVSFHRSYYLDDLRPRASRYRFAREESGRIQLW